MRLAFHPRLSVAIILLVAGTAVPSDAANLAPPRNPPVRAAGSFTTVVGSYVEATLGRDNLPTAEGDPLNAGLLVTIAMDAVHISDQPVTRLQAGRFEAGSEATACEKACPRTLLDVCERTWMELAVTGATLSAGIPEWVTVAADRSLPARTAVQAAYAMAQSRPIGPPFLAFVVDGGAGLRGRQFFLVPPAGLRLQSGAAALGLTIEVEGANGFVVSSTDTVSRHRVGDRKTLAIELAQTSRRNPGKRTIVLVPGPDATVGDLLAVAELAGQTFPRLVLSLGQRIEL